MKKLQVLQVSRNFQATRSVPRHVDSVEKLADRLALVAKVRVVYNGKLLRPEPPRHLFLSPSLLREFRCHTGCTACCLSITLDFTMDEWRRMHWREGVEEEARRKFRQRRIGVNGRIVTIMSYPQYKDPSCPFLRPVREEGVLGCGFWSASNATQPLECSSAPQLSMTTRGPDTTVLMKRPFGRGWAWKERPQCEFEPTLDGPGDLARAVDLRDEIALLRRYQHWADVLHIPTHLPAIITAMQHLKERVKQDGVHLVPIF